MDSKKIVQNVCSLIDAINDYKMSKEWSKNIKYRTVQTYKDILAISIDELIEKKVKEALKLNAVTNGS